MVNLPGLRSPLGAGRREKEPPKTCVARGVSILAGGTSNRLSPCTYVAQTNCGTTQCSPAHLIATTNAREARTSSAPLLLPRPVPHAPRPTPLRQGGGQLGITLSLEPIAGFLGGGSSRCRRSTVPHGPRALGGSAWTTVQSPGAAKHNGWFLVLNVFLVVSSSAAPPPSVLLPLLLPVCSAYIAALLTKNALTSRNVRCPPTAPPKEMAGQLPMTDRQSVSSSLPSRNHVACPLRVSKALVKVSSAPKLNETHQGGDAAAIPVSPGQGGRSKNGV